MAFTELKLDEANMRGDIFHRFQNWSVVSENMDLKKKTKEVDEGEWTLLGLQNSDLCLQHKWWGKVHSVVHVEGKVSLSSWKFNTGMPPLKIKSLERKEKGERKVDCLLGITSLSASCTASCALHPGINVSCPSITPADLGPDDVLISA